MFDDEFETLKMNMSVLTRLKHKKACTRFQN